MTSLLLFVVVACVIGAVSVEASTTRSVTVCPRLGSIARGDQYHADTVCDRTAYNHYKSTLGRYMTYQAYKLQGGIKTVPNQKTVHCPASGERVNMRDEHAPNDGLDTVWFVENRASTPVVVAYVLPNSGIEVSVQNTHITPAVMDPAAILAPGAWMAVYAYEGHEFVVREVKGANIAGNVLMQHRAGLIPIGANFATSAAVACPNPDIEPKENNVTAPAFQRTPTQDFRPCHTMDIGFRNVAHCPLHGYHVQGEGTSCQEVFKMHLGVESVTTDYQKDWVSNAKFEGTFIGHTFHFRLASNPSVLVDSITLAPVIVTDCPVSAAPVKVQVRANGLNVDGRVQDDEFSNATSSGRPASAPKSAAPVAQYVFASSNMTHNYAAKSGGSVGWM